MPSGGVRGGVGLAAVVAALALLPASSAPARTERVQALDLFEAAILRPSHDAGQHDFGVDVDLSRDGRVAIVGGPYRTGTPFTQNQSGAVWIYERSGPEWREDVWLEGRRDGPRGSERTFGSAVALSGNGRLAVVGSPWSIDGKRGKGSVWVFANRSGNTWVGSRLAARDVGGEAQLGADVAVSADGSTIVVGGPGERGNRGAVWIFTRSPSGWTQVAKLTGANAKGKARFGESVAISDDKATLLVGGPSDADGKGAVWLFRRSGSGWKQHAKIARVEMPGVPAFGDRIELSGDGKNALIGAFVQGAVFLRVTPSSWTLRARLKPAEPLTKEEQSGFGRRIALSGDGLTALVGGNAGFARKRSAWLFRRASAGATFSWEGPRLTGPTRFGDSLALSQKGDVALIGRDIEDAEKQRRGSVTVFARGIPVVTRVAPKVGPEPGGTNVTITGRNFTNVRAVRFGSRAAASFAVDSPTRIRAAAPPGEAGPVHVRVTNDVGISLSRRTTSSPTSRHRSCSPSHPPPARLPEGRSFGSSARASTT